jgi:hypothetical protein
MYDTRLIEDSLSLDSILEKVTEYDVYSYYIGDKFSIGKVISSPFREDKNPSFGIFKSNKTSSLLYKDLSTGSTGNCVQFVQQLFKLSYRDSLIKILDDYKNNLLKISTEGITIKEDYRSTNTIISVRKKPFCKTDDLYWNQFGLFRDDLRHFNVYPIQEYWINEIVQPWSYNEANPGYSYQVYNKYKIYKPKALKKEGKWIGNCTNYDIQGLEQLDDKGHLLIITKSLKDVMVLYKLGYKSIAPNSENNGVPKCIIDNLKSRFTKILILYDNDEAGRKGAINLSTKTNFNTIFIPLDNFATKDISDYVKRYGIEQTSKLMKELCEEDTNKKNKE